MSHQLQNEVAQLRNALGHWQRRVNELCGYIDRMKTDYVRVESVDPGEFVRPTINGPISLVDTPAKIASQLTMPMIARALANTGRYSGNTPWFYSVAEHCVMVSCMNNIPDINMGRLALMHDAGEALYGDFIKPLRGPALVNPVLHGIVKRVDAAVDLRWALLPDDGSVAHSDNIIQYSEMAAMYTSAHVVQVTEDGAGLSLRVPGAAYQISGVEMSVLRRTIVGGGSGLSPNEAYAAFMHRAEQLNLL